MSLQSALPIPDEAFGTFLSSSPPAISTLAIGCGLWDGAHRRLPPVRRFARGHVAPALVKKMAAIPATAQLGDAFGRSSAAVDDDGRRVPDCDSIFLKESSPIDCAKSETRNRVKKRVTFADNLGFDLEAIKVIREDASTPPPAMCISTDTSLSPAFSAAPIVSVATIPQNSEVPRQPCFHVDFVQPVSNYASFKSRLSACFIAVENVAIDAQLADVAITVKVMNLTFEKHVFIRASRNGWKTYRDFNASYVNSNAEGINGQLQTLNESSHDTFYLRADLAGALEASSFLAHIEFAACYQTSTGEQFWDSNEGANYKLVADYGVPNAKKTVDCRTDCKHNSATWSTYAVWRSSSLDVPYW